MNKLKEMTQKTIVEALKPEFDTVGNIIKRVDKKASHAKTFGVIGAVAGTCALVFGAAAQKQHKEDLQSSDEAIGILRDNVSELNDAILDLEAAVRAYDDEKKKECACKAKNPEMTNTSNAAEVVDDKNDRVERIY